jgi:Tol biopolymer transport system component
VFSPGPGSGLQRVASAGGVPAAVTQPEAGGGHRFPEFLPDGRRFLFLAGTNKAETSGVYAGSLDGRPPVRIRSGETNAMFAPAAAGQPGLLLFREENTLMAQPFDPERLAFGGEIFPVAEQVGQGGNRGFGAFTVSANGTLAYQEGPAIGPFGNWELVWLDRNGKRQVVPGVKPGPIGYAELSPDERRIALTMGAASQGTSDIWLLDLGRAALTRFTFGPGLTYSPVWSPDGSRLAFSRIPPNANVPDTYQKSLAGAGEERLFQGGVNTFPTDWSRDGKFLVYQTSGAQTRADLWLLPLDGDRKPKPYLQTPFDEVAGQFSPDGRWLACVSNESGQEQVYVQPVPVSGAKWQVSTAGGQQPRWRRDGRELFYLDADSRLMAVPVQTSGSGSFEPGAPQPLFDLPGAARLLGGRHVYQPTANGQRFLALLPAEGEASPPITVVLNWQAGLKK